MSILLFLVSTHLVSQSTHLVSHTLRRRCITRHYTSRDS